MTSLRENNKCRMAQAAEKCRGRLLIAAVLLLALAVPSGAENYTKVYEDDVLGTSWFLDLDSIEDRGSYVVVWAIGVIASEDALMISRTMYGLSKTYRQFKILSQGLFKNDYVIFNENFSFYDWRWQECAQGTIPYIVWNTVMQAIGYR